MVKPLLTRCIGCHSTNLPNEPNLTSFATLQDKYKMKPGATNIFVTKGDHQGTTYFAPAEKTAVANWIDSL